MFLRPSDVDAMCDAAGSLNISEAKPKAKASPKSKAKKLRVIKSQKTKGILQKLKTLVARRQRLMRMRCQ